MFFCAGLLAWFGHAGAQEATGAAPADFASLATIYGDMLAAQDVAVTMRDGIDIAVDIYRPDDNRRHPALFAAGPYPHTQAILADRGSDIGPVAWYVSQGYAVVVASVRGTGKSTGDFGFFTREEQQDHYEVIEWIARQAWSDGQVAGTGAGYYAASQWQMAIQNPPHLACIAPVNGATNPFMDWISPGGLANNAFINDWYDAQVRLPNAYTPGVNTLVNFDLRLAQLSHPFFDAFWQLRSSEGDARLVNVPVYALHDWNADPLSPGIAGTVRSMASLNVINKLLVVDASNGVPLQQDIAFLGRELLPFYQWCFTGKTASAAFIALPRIRYQVRGQNTLKRESTWPPGNIAQQGWFLNHGAGSDSGSLDVASLPATLGFSAYDRQDPAAKLVFISAPLPGDLEIAGPLMLEMYASGSADDMAFQVTLKEQLVYRSLAPAAALPSLLGPAAADSGALTETSAYISVSQGSLKASRRARLPGTGNDYSPVYAQTAAESLNPGQVYRLDLGMHHTAYRFSAGNRLVLEVTPVNDGSLMNGPGRDMLHHSRQYPTRLWLPVVQSPAFSSQRQNPQTVPAENPVNMQVPDLRILTPETLEALEGDSDNPVLFVPR